MERITIKLRTTKKKGEIKLRFRLSDTRSVDLYHKSEISADLSDLEKFNMDGTVRPKVTIYNKKLKKEIDTHIAAMRKAYNALCEKMDKTHISGELFEAEVSKILNTEVKVVDQKTKKETMLHRFERYIEAGFNDGIFDTVRKRNYMMVLGELERFLSVKHLKRISADEFTADMLLAFREYIKNEYLYVPKYPKHFEHLNNRRIPKAELADNTLATRMKMVQAFFNELLDLEEIEVSPFHKLGRKRKANVLRETYERAFFLRQDEVLKIMETEVPESMAQVKDAFLLNCACGWRINEFQKMSWKYIYVSEEGIPYFNYYPSKRKKTDANSLPIETPIMLFALEIIKKWNFDIPLIKYAGGERGYNVKIRQLLEYCGITRSIPRKDGKTGELIHRPISELASSKLARKTFVDMLQKVQIHIDRNAAGLHAAGSNAISHYTAQELIDRNVLMCKAFKQPEYTVDKDFNVVEIKS